jgi:hypothetical protein
MKLIILFLFCLSITAQAGSLPDPRLTPGKTREVSLKELCTPGYSQTVRHVTLRMKKVVFTEYGIAYYPGISADYEIDHLVSLELGGSNDIANLWPEPWKEPLGAHEKDKVENFLHHEVCAGRMSLEEAQREIAQDWVKVYRERYLRRLGRKNS